MYMYTFSTYLGTKPKCKHIVWLKGEDEDDDDDEWGEAASRPGEQGHDYEQIVSCASWN